MHHSHARRLRRDTWVELHPAGGAGSHLLRAWLGGGGGGLVPRVGDTQEPGFISHTSSIISNSELDEHLKVPFGSCAWKG